jgi:NAD(P)-dependent dehydrogenase (short-subunit alcohol dehydrogenase family)
MKWTHDDMPDQTGRTAIVTGANTGIGYETARFLAGKGARVILACRSREKGQEAAARITAEKPAGRAKFVSLDLSDLESVRAFADDYERDDNTLDLLINNAGVMMCPESKTRQGFELQLGVNHLGHFALTGLLLDTLRVTPGSRVVTVSSMAHRRGKMDFNDLMFTTRGYDAMAAYCQSKLANLLFTFELHRKLEAAGTDTFAVAAHPGWTSTDLQRHSWWIRTLNPLFGMKPDRGALPTLRAAIAPDVMGGEYYGPNGWQEMKGYPVRVGTIDAATDKTDAARLWEISEELTGVRFEAIDRR